MPGPQDRHRSVRDWGADSSQAAGTFPLPPELFGPACQNRVASSTGNSVVPVEPEQIVLTDAAPQLPVRVSQVAAADP